MIGIVSTNSNKTNEKNQLCQEVQKYFTGVRLLFCLAIILL